MTQSEQSKQALAQPHLSCALQEHWLSECWWTVWDPFLALTLVALPPFSVACIVLLAAFVAAAAGSFASFCASQDFVHQTVWLRAQLSPQLGVPCSLLPFLNPVLPVPLRCHWWRGLQQCLLHEFLQPGWFTTFNSIEKHFKAARSSAKPTGHYKTFLLAFWVVHFKLLNFA